MSFPGVGTWPLDLRSGALANQPHTPFEKRKKEKKPRNSCHTNTCYCFNFCRSLFFSSSVVRGLLKRSEQRKQRTVGPSQIFQTRRGGSKARSGLGSDPRDGPLGNVARTMRQTVAALKAICHQLHIGLVTDLQVCSLPLDPRPSQSFECSLSLGNFLGSDISRNPFSREGPFL